MAEEGVSVKDMECHGSGVDSIDCGVPSVCVISGPCRNGDHCDVLCEVNCDVTPEVTRKRFSVEVSHCLDRLIVWTVVSKDAVVRTRDKVCNEAGDDWASSVVCAVAKEVNCDVTCVDASVIRESSIACTVAPKVAREVSSDVVSEVGDVNIVDCKVGSGTIRVTVAGIAGRLVCEALCDKVCGIDCEEPGFLIVCGLACEAVGEVV